MTIIQIMPEFALAGAEIMCENLTYELVKLGHNVIAVSMYDYHSAITDRFEKSGVKIVYLGKKGGLDFSMISKMKKLFSDIKPDVIQTHRYCAQYAVPAAMLAGVKTRIHTLHSVAVKENANYARKLNKFFFKHCNVIPVALSELVRETVIDEYMINKDKIPVIYNGINLSKCIVKTNYSTNGNFKIIHIGRFSEPKNHIGLLEAFNSFHNKHSDSELWLIGDGEKKAEIQDYVKENDLIESVKFLGLQDNVYGFLHDADIFTLPSNYEGIPMTLIEAMGTGMPIVATEVGGIPDMLDESSALLVPVDSVAIADAFEKYYLSYDLRKTHGQKALEQSKRFSAETMAKSYIEIYKGR